MLFAEDEESNKFLLQKYFETSSNQFNLVANGQEAVDEATKNKYDLIFMDMHMDVMDGYEAVEKIRCFERENSVKSTPIVAFTSCEDPAQRKRSLDLGCNSILDKPFSFADLDNFILNIKV